MDFTKQVVDQRVRKIVEENPGLDVFESFLLLGVAAYFDKDIADVVSYITEGGNDGGFDAVSINVGNDILDVTLFQAKYARDLENDSNFPANAVEKAVVSVKSIFDPKAFMLLNEKSRRVVDQIRSYIADGYIPFVTVVMLNNGLLWNQDGQNKIDNEFKNDSHVKFLHFNHKNMLDSINRTDSIKTKIHFSGKVIGEQLMYNPVVVGRVCIEEIAGLMETHGDTILDRNVRKYLGKNTFVNKDIHSTLLSEDDRKNFFFYNNGITMVCKSLLYNELQKEDWVVQAEDIQIINGGQTCRTIQETLKQNPSLNFSNAYVLVRIYALGGNEQIALGITKATNTQNPIDLRDLHANEPEQELLETSAKDLGYIYKRKRDAVINSNADTITSSAAAEAVFTIWHKSPHLLRRKKDELFNAPLYDEIFKKSLNAAQMIIAVLIYRYCDNMRRKNSNDVNKAAHRYYSQYVLAAMIGQKLLDDCNILLEKLNHINFAKVKEHFDSNIEAYYVESEDSLVSLLKNKYFDGPLCLVDGRALSAVFRRFEIVSYLFPEK